MKKMVIYKNSVIYLVDDDIIIRDSLSVLIESIGLKINSFESAQSFLNSYIPDQPGCLILDVRMPIMNGLELQEELSKRNIQIPIIFISGNAEIPDSAKAFRAGAVDFLEKPFDTNLLIERIYEALSKDIENKKQRLGNSKTQACFNTLSNREKEVLQLIINNYSNKEVAKELGVSHRTIEAHRARIMEKMQVGSTTELVGVIVSHALF
jgi:RNA polymerase sigma factor (sigma-70 family)